MEYAPLGQTGLMVSRLSFGASALGGVYGPADEAEGIRAVHAALAAGITHFDVAPAYGATRAETVLGKALKGVPRDSYVLSTKVGKYTRPAAYGDDELDYSEARIRRGLAESMDRLGTDYLDIVHLHDFEYQGRREVESAFASGFPALMTLREEGQLGIIGAGIYPLDLWNRVLAEAPVQAILMHNHYCLNDTRGLDLLPACRAGGIGVVCAAPFATGLLTGRPPADWHPASTQERDLVAQVAQFCLRHGSSLPKLAIQFATQDSPFDTTLFSAATVIEVERNLIWHQEPLDKDLLSEVQAMLEPIRDKQWDFDAGVERLKATSSAGVRPPGRLPS